MRTPRYAALLLVLIFQIVALAAAPLAAQDTDDDGISDEVETLLLTDLNFAEEFEAVAEHPAGEVGPDGGPLVEPRYDIETVWLANVAEGRWLWAIEFAEDYKFDNTVLIFYLDTDNNPDTGREGMGCEIAYRQITGRPGVIGYAPDGQRQDAAPARIAIENGVLYICADVDLHEENDRSHFRMQINSEKLEPREGVDSLRMAEFTGPGQTEREKPIREKKQFEVRPAAEAGPDTDGDGISDAVERRLGSDPSFPEEFEAVAESPLGEVVPGRPGRFDMGTLWLANVAKGRWLFAVEFAEPFTFENCYMLIYIDSDNDPKTGRVGHGCDFYWIASEHGGSGVRYTPDGDRAGASDPRVVIENGVLYFCGEMDLNQENGRSKFRMQIALETREPGKKQDYIAYTPMEGPGDSERVLAGGMSTVEGTVVDADDNPVAGARVRAILMSGKAATELFSPALDLQTDENGHFEGELAPGRYWPTVTKGSLTSAQAGYGVRTWSLAAGIPKDEVKIVLNQGGTVQGTTVRGADESPVPGAKIVLDGGQSATADAQGRFRIEGAAAGEGNLRAIAEGLACDGRQYFVQAGEEAQVTVKLEPAYTVRGTITDEQGKPVAEARVSITGRQDRGILRYAQSTHSDEAGVFVWPGLTSSRQREAFYVAHRDFAGQSVPLPAPPAEGATATIEIVLDMGYAIQGLVLTPDGEPAAGAMARRGGHGGFDAAGAVKTDDQGRFRIEKLSSEDETVVLMEFEGYAPAAQRIKPGRGEELPTVTFQLEEGHTATGRVVDAEGNPIAAAALQAHISAGEWGRIEVGHFRRSGDDGTFAYPDLPVEGVTMEVHAPGFGRVSAVPLKMDEDNVIVMQRLGVIKGKVIDAETGRPVTKFNVKLGQSKSGGQGASYSYRMTTTGQDFEAEDGTFTLSDIVRPAAYAVIVTAEGYAPTRADPVTGDAEDAEQWPVIIKLGHGITLAGTVRAAETGEPVPDAEVTLLIPKGEYRYFEMSMLEEGAGREFTIGRTKTDADGRFSFEGVGEQEKFMLAVRHNEYAPAVIREIDPAAPLEVKLAHGGRLVGTVAGFVEAEATGLEITLYSSRSRIDFGRHPVNADGSFEMKKLPPGEYRLALWEPGGERGARYNKRIVRLEIKAGETTELNFAELPGVNITGRVTLAGAPVSDCRVYIDDLLARDRIAGGQTDEEGRYKFVRIPGGLYTIRATSWDYNDPMRRLYHAYARVQVEQADVEHDIKLETGKIAGSIVDGQSSKPLRNVGVSALPLREEPGDKSSLERYMSEQGELRFTMSSAPWSYAATGLRATSRLGMPTTTSGGGSGRSAQEGRFDIVGLAPGSYLLTFGAEAVSPRNFAGPVTVTEGAEPPVVELKTDSTASLRLRIVNGETGEAISGAKLVLCTADGYQLTDRVRRAATAGEAMTEGPRGVGEEIRSDDQGLVGLDAIQATEYGVWVMAPGYGARWVAPLTASAEAAEGEPVRIEMQPTGVLVIKPEPGLLAGIDNAYVVYRISDADGQVVFPGGEGQGRGVWDTGAAALGGERPEGFRVEVLPVGSYTMKWELHRGPTVEQPSPRGLEPLASGEAQLQITKGEETLLVLSK